MPLDVWFPLAIYWADLAGAAGHNPAIGAAITDLVDGTSAEGGGSANPASSWTGDVHGVDRLHDDPRFAWLTESVAQHAWTYLAELGHDLDEVELHVQRSWPVITRPGEFVAAHEHHNAHLSAVYYVESTAEAGSIRFLNTDRPNELSPGSSGSKGTFRNANPLNFGSTQYEPIPGRLLLFPSKHRHEVLANETTHERLSISFDLVLSTRSDRAGGSHEFLMPPPERWKRLRRATVSGEVEIRMDRPIDLGLINRRRDVLDEIALVDEKHHPLWRSALYPHVISQHHRQLIAAHRAASEGILNAGEAHSDSRDHGGDSRASIVPNTPVWEVFRDSIDRLHDHLVAGNVSTAGSLVADPRLVAAGSPNCARRGSDLEVYVRLDGRESFAAVEFADSSELLALEPGSLAVVSGLRAHRVVGDADLLAISAMVPTLARPTGPQRSALLASARSDLAAFHAVTAVPISASLPSIDIVDAKLERRARACRRATSLTGCDVSRKYLIDGYDPAEATAAERAVIRTYGTTTDEIVETGTGVVEHVALLDEHHCAQLVDHARLHMTSNVPDSVDDRPEYQVNLTTADLHRLLGKTVTNRMFAVPAQLLERLGDDRVVDTERMSVFIRVFTADTREHLGFHADISGVTLNVPIESEPVDGGKLLLLYGGALHEAPRERGVALCHDSRVVHGVSRMKNGERWSLIVFAPTTTR